MYTLGKMTTLHPINSIAYFMEKTGIHRMDDRKYVEYVYERVNDGERLNLDHPVTYTEKLNWMKLHDRNPMYTVMVDKLHVKKMVSSKIGREYVIPLAVNGGVWSNVDDIDFAALPNQFVLKTNHDCGGVAICRDKSKFDVKKIKEDFRQRLKTNFYYAGREWPYKDVGRKVFCEAYIEGLSDHNYKFFCFNGKVKVLYVAPYREKTVDYFDADYKHLDIYTRIHGPASLPPEKPGCFNKMRELAETLSEGIPAVRVDLYEVKGKIYFGEFTFFQEAGFVPYLPKKWNQTFGDWLNLPK